VGEQMSIIQLVAVTTVLLDILDDESLAPFVDHQTLARLRALRERANARLDHLTENPKENGEG
jgi:hypothetical protein